MSEIKKIFVRKNSCLAWFLAARPKTLVGGAVPVLVGATLAWHHQIFVWTPTILCFFFALFSQIAANFINDYIDFRKGTDRIEERLGPARATASGWIEPSKMRTATFLALGIAGLFGLGLIGYGGGAMILVGIISALFCLLYSAGPVPLSYVGLGDVLVLVFFGFVAVSFTYYVQARQFCVDLIPLSLMVGFATDNILVANNYRDRNEDRKNHKWTLIALFGERFGRYFYLVNGGIVSILALVYLTRDFGWPAILMVLVYLTLHLRSWLLLNRIRQGTELNRVLELTAKNLLCLGVILSVCFVFF